MQIRYRTVDCMIASQDGASITMDVGTYSNAIDYFHKLQKVKADRL